MSTLEQFPLGSRLKHQQLRKKLLLEITNGRFRPGDMLPSENNLAKSMSVSRSTVRLTLGQLEREGLVRRVQGRGTYVGAPSQNSVLKRTETLAMVVPEVIFNYYPNLASTFEQAASDAGRPVMVFNTGNDVDKQASQLMHAIDQRVAGLLFLPSLNAATPAYQVRLVQSAGIPVILLHRAVADAQAPLLEIPFRDISRFAAQSILEAGHRIVAYLGNSSVESKGLEALFRQALSEAGVVLDDDLVVDCGNRLASPSKVEHHIEQIMTRLFGRPRRPTAIFSASFDIAEAVYMLAVQMGVRVPDELSIACVGGDRRERAVMRRLTLFVVDEFGAARQAVKTLTDMMNGIQPICQHVSIPLRWHQRVPKVSNTIKATTATSL